MEAPIGRSKPQPASIGWNGGTDATDHGTDHERRARILVALDHPAQHFSPTFRAMAQDPSIALLVIYGHVPEGATFDPGFDQPISWDVDLLGGYQWTTDEPTAIVKSFVPDILVVFGWAKPVARKVLALALRRPEVARRTFLYGDSTWQDSSTPALRHLRRSVLHALFGRVGGAVSSGTFNRDFYVRFGMSPTSIWPGVCPADITHYRLRDRTSRNERRFLYAGKFTERKGVDVLLRAAHRLGTSEEWSLTLAGDGPERSRLNAIVSDTPIQERVTFEGFVNQSRLPSLMAEHDFLVVPSTRDLRVLVVLEGMAAGLVPIVSDATAVWGPNDVVAHGKNGYVFPSGDENQLALVMRSILGRDHGRERSLGATMAEQHRPEVLAEQLVELVRSVRSGSFPLKYVKTLL